jgi:GT2 family glycosyltransferase
MILYYSEKYLAKTIPSLLNQSERDFEIFFLDHTNGASNDLAYIQKNFKDERIKCIKRENLGFAAGHNYLINLSQADFYACLNPDMFFKSDFLEKALSAIKKSSKIAAISPKIYRWDFAKAEYSDSGKTKTIDTCGLALKKNHRFYDIGQGAEDAPEYDEKKEVFGVSGAAAIYRKEALFQIAFNKGAKKEYFDELMFMYKEDCDLAYRLKHAAFITIFEPKAIAYHDRTVAQKERGLFALLKNQKHKSLQVKKWSFLHQLILLYKNFDQRYPFSIKFQTFAFHFLLLIYNTVFVFKTNTFYPQFTEAQKKELSLKRKTLLRKNSVAEMLKWFS